MKFDFEYDESLLTLKEATIYFQGINRLLLHSMDVIEGFIESKEMEAEDIQELEHENPYMPVQYFCALFQQFRNLYFQQEKEIAFCLLEATLSESWKRAELFYDSADFSNWQKKHLDYVTECIRFGDNSEVLVNYVTRLWTAFELLHFCYQVARGEIKHIPFVFDECFGFQTIKTPVFNMEELEKKAILEPDSEKKIQLYQNEIFRLKIYLNEYPERLNFESESEYHDRTDDVHEFIHKCESHIQIIKETMGIAPIGNAAERQESGKVIKRSGGEVRCASKKKTDIIKILSAMYDAKMFADAEGKPLTNKQEMMEAFGAFLGDDFSAYSASLSQAKKTNEKVFLKPFKDIEKEALRYYNEVKE